MSDWYPYREESKTMNLRWYVFSKIDGTEDKILQQKISIREGVGNEAKYTEEWREIETFRDT